MAELKVYRPSAKKNIIVKYMREPIEFGEVSFENRLKKELGIKN